MKYTRWTCGRSKEEDVKRLMEAGYPRLVSSVLSARGISTAREAAEFLGQEQPLHDPFLMKDMDKAAARVLSAVENGERIAVFGDYDVDGITATVLLVDYLRSLGADCVKYIPRRVEDGYGLGKEPMRYLVEKEHVRLIVTVDCGITAREEAEYAKELGIDLVITDHHECKEELPQAVAVVNPHRSDCSYPFPCLAGVGVALKLVLAMGGKENQEALFHRYATLAAIGTVADVMKMSDENRTIVAKGLTTIHDSGFIGLSALLKETGLWEKTVTSIQIGFVLAPRLNAAGRMGEAELAADLLLTKDPARAEELARELCTLNRERQTVEQEIFAQAVEQIDDIPPELRSALVLESEAWHQGVVGIVASRLAEKYSCPSFMIHLSDGLGKCSCRSYGGFNLFTALESCADLLEEFGGHELAAGFTIRQENIAAFRCRINGFVSDYLNGETPVSSLELDTAIDCPEDVNLFEVESLDMLEPYGAGNNRPAFMITGMKVESMQAVGQNRHLKLRLSRGKTFFDAIYFSAAQEAAALQPGQRVDAAFHLQINEFRGSRTVQLQILDIRPSRTESARERECIRLVRTLLTGEPVKCRDAQRMIPVRHQFVRLWQTLLRMAGSSDGIAAPRMPLLRELSQGMGGTEPFLRTLVALKVFEERGLLTLAETEPGRLAIVFRPLGQEKAVLEDCPYMRQLSRFSQQKGGSYYGNG